MNRVAVLVVSCDKYSDLWDPFFKIFWQRWPDCPYAVSLGTNHIVWRGSGVTTLVTGDDRGWGYNFRRMLEQIDASRIIVFLEDFFLVRPVITQEVERMVSLAVENRVACLRLRPAPPPTRRIPGLANLGELQRGDDYRVSTQVAIWEPDFLRALSMPEFTAWQFETIGTYLSYQLPDKFWGVYEPVIDYRHAVERGRWLPQGLDLCQQTGVKLDLSVRETIDKRELVRNRVRGLVSFKGILKRLMPSSFLRQIRLRRRMAPEYVFSKALSADEIVENNLSKVSVFRPGHNGK